MTPSKVDARRPLIYVAVGAVLALGSLLLPGPGAGGREVAAAPAPAPAPAAPTAPCNGVERSLRPGPLPPPGAMPAGSTMAKIVERGRLRVAVDQGKYRVGFRNPATGALEGSDIDLARSIAQAIFGSPDRVQFVVVNIADRASVVASGQADITVNTFTITCARQQVVSFSAPYLTATQRLLVPKGSGISRIEDLKGKTVCTSTGSTTVAVLKETDGVEVTTLPGIPDCMVEMQSGRVAAVSSDELILAGLAAQDPQTEVVGGVLDSAVYGVAVPKGAEDMVRFVNGVLEKIRADGTMASSLEKWLGGYLDPLPQSPTPVYRD
ncbi:MAG: glutamate ABC transporter substrate-binding protein [Pseudonocardia sp.]|nr:glutamate ABC transporter substrate-binding protein [Pseudonocardia sp.]